MYIWVILRGGNRKSWGFLGVLGALGIGFGAAWPGIQPICGLGLLATQICGHFGPFFQALLGHMVELEATKGLCYKFIVSEQVRVVLELKEHVFCTAFLSRCKTTRHTDTQEPTDTQGVSSMVPFALPRSQGPTLWHGSSAHMRQME